MGASCWEAVSTKLFKPLAAAIHWDRRVYYVMADKRIAVVRFDVLELPPSGLADRLE